MAKLELTFSDDEMAYLKARAAAEGFAAVEAMIKADYARTIEQDEALKALLRERLASGESVPVDAAFWSRIDAAVDAAESRHKS